MELTAAHWTYLAGVIVIIAIMIARKNVVVPAVAATFVTAVVYTKSPVASIGSIFNASLVAAGELFSIFLIIALVTSLLGSLQTIGADRWLVAPFRVLIRNASSAFLVLFGATFFISLFFWPTPAVPLVGAILLPVAIRAGLPPMVGAMVIAISGQGMALSSDYVIQVAPGLSATAAGAPPGEVADKAFILAAITGVIALAIAYFMSRKNFQKPSQALLTEWEALAEGKAATPDDALRHDHDAKWKMGTSTAYERDKTVRTRLSKFVAMLTAIGFAALIVFMMLGKFTDLFDEVAGGEAAAMVGGTAAILMLISTIVGDRKNFLDSAAQHVVDGLVFAFKAMGVVIPIAGFFFMGNSDFAGPILGLGEDQEAPGLLFELVEFAQSGIPMSALTIGFGILLVGIATGLDGSGFSGLPLTGSLAGSFAPAVGMEPSTLAAIGQMGAIWAGGGTFIAWSSVIAVAGIARVSVIDLTRKLFVPVLVGLVVSTVVATLLL